MAKKVKLYEYKTINSRGATHHLIRMQGEESWKHHRWEGPAIVPHSKNSEFKKSYFLNGTEYNSEEYSELMSEREGLPWYKQAAPKGSTYRN
mgnify:FL=1|tara:strand:- start:625 stop:900 length:276 start_codon:yes stop_codon:yes gene_type:complete